MPELPEVETIVRRLQPQITGRCVKNVECQWAREIIEPLASFRRQVNGKTIEAVSRRAKYILLHFADDTLVTIHLRMTGRLDFFTENIPLTRHERVRFLFHDGSVLVFADARKFGRIERVTDPAAFEQRLGIEPLSPRFTSKTLLALCEHRRTPLKAFLLDQTTIAGLGNIYSDEALFAAALHPLRPAQSLNKTESQHLVTSIRAVLKKAIRLNGTSLDWAYPGGTMQHRLNAYGRTGEACPRCGTSIERIVVQQRSTHFCPNCQT